MTGHNIDSYDDKTIQDCMSLCLANENCLAFEYGVAYGGAGTRYKVNDCILQKSSDKTGCDGSIHNLDLYVKGTAKW